MKYGNESKNQLGKICPFCGHKINSGNCQEAYGISAGRINRPAICPTCNFRWTICYQFEDIDETTTDSSHNQKLIEK